MTTKLSSRHFGHYVQPFRHKTKQTIRLLSSIIICLQLILPIKQCGQLNLLTLMTMPTIFTRHLHINKFLLYKERIFAGKFGFWVWKNKIWLIRIWEKDWRVLISFLRHYSHDVPRTSPISPEIKTLITFQLFIVATKTFEFIEYPFTIQKLLVVSAVLINNI